jgi:ribonuclease III
MTNDYSHLEHELNYTFSNQTILKQALTHKTYAFEADQPIQFNERLEFLGDSILNFIIAKYLYQKNKFFSEGELTRRRAQLVNNKNLSSIAKTLNIGSYLRLGKGEIQQSGHLNNKNIANAFEALIGAIYIDSDITITESVILHLFQLHEHKKE